MRELRVTGGIKGQKETNQLWRARIDCGCKSCMEGLGRMTVQFVEDVTEEEKTDVPCWVGFPQEDQGDKIRMTYEEGEAGVWVLRGWDVGYLPEGLANAVKIEWVQ